jgi:cytochrome c peroxidase
MKKTLSVLVLFAIVIIAYSCKKNSGSQPLSTSAILVLPSTPEQFYDTSSFGGMGQYADSLNRVATLGKVLFYDSHLSLNNSISCGSCHKQSLGFADNAALSTGYQGMLTKRNSLGLNNLQRSFNLFWDGRENNIQNLAIRPLTNHVEMGISDPTYLPAKLSAISYYNSLFLNAFGDNSVTTDRITSAIGVFLSAMNCNNSRLDQYNNGNTSALTAQEINGKNLFTTKYNCATCHNNTGGGFYSGSNSFKDIGLDANYSDLGRGTVTGLASDNGTFLIPDLRNVALTAPYMHDGRYKTLDDVLEHYSHGINNSPNLDPLLKDAQGNPMVLNISETDKAAIIAFLNAQTDYTLVLDPKFSNPFKAN